MELSVIKRRLLEQDESVKNVLQQNLVPRLKLGVGEAALNTPLVKAIIGPRRSGKTTFGFQLLNDKDFYYVNFDDEVLSGIKKEELGLILESLHELFGKRKHIFLDEIQNIDGWELFVNRLHRLEYNVVISGSNSHLLSSELASHLGGRVYLLEILPFSFREYISAVQQEILPQTDEGIGLMKNRLKEYLAKGGFPEIVLKIPKELSSGYYDELFNMIILRDIAQRHTIRQTGEIISLSNIILNTFSTRQSNLKISKSIGISSHTIKRYLSYLEESYLILPCKKFSYKPREVESSFRKYYAIDTGLLHSKKMAGSPDFGKIMENTVALELRTMGKALFYYMAEDKYESDFVVFDKNRSTEVLQVCNDENHIPAREKESGLRACKELKCKRLTIITWNAKEKRTENGVVIQKIPLWEWLLNGEKNREK